MGEFRTYTIARREPVRAMAPIRDVTVWTPESLRDVERRSYWLSDGERAQRIDASCPTGAALSCCRDIRSMRWQR